MDAWNQMLKLTSILNPPPHLIREDRHQDKIWKYWTQETKQGFRKWKQGDHLNQTMDIPLTDELEKELCKQRINILKTGTFCDAGTCLKELSPRPKPTKLCALTGTPLTHSGTKSGGLDPGPRSPTSFG